jgi:hypothetical protein
LEGWVDLVGEHGQVLGVEAGDRILAQRRPREDLAPDPDLPEDTRLWALLQEISGGPWQGCVYDVERLHQLLRERS